MAESRKAQQGRTARTAEATTIGEGGVVLTGGEFTINGGVLRMTDASGNVGLLYFGPDADGSGQTWQFSFPNGDGAFGLFGSSGRGYWAGKDHGNNILISNDSASGAGLAKPYLNIPMYPSSGTSVGTGGPFWPQFTNTSYQEVMHGITTLWHPRIRVGVATNTSSGTVDWQLQVDGDVIGSGSGTGLATGEVPGWGDTTNPGDQVSVQLWCRNTTGTASRVTVDYCYGLQS
jgi:hypothetical protein